MCVCVCVCVCVCANGVSKEDGRVSRNAIKCPSHPMGSQDYMGLSFPSHSPMGPSVECPLIPLQMHVCPTVHPILRWRMACASLCLLVHMVLHDPYSHTDVF